METILIVIVVVKIICDVGHHGENGDGHGEEGHLRERDGGRVRQGGTRLSTGTSVQGDVHHALLTLQAAPAFPLRLPGPGGDVVKHLTIGRPPLFSVEVSP